MPEFIDKKTSAQRIADELSKRQEVVTTPTALEESWTDETLQSPEQPPTPMRHPQHVPQTLTLVESPRIQRSGSPEAPLSDPLIRHVPTPPGDAQTYDQSSAPVRLSRSQKYKAKRIAKKQAQEESGAHLAHAEVTMGLP